jgi:hypothetical protein
MWYGILVYLLQLLLLRFSEVETITGITKESPQRKVKNGYRKRKTENADKAKSKYFDGVFFYAQRFYRE